MQTIENSVCNMEMFDGNSKHFWTSDLLGLLENFPQLELPHKSDFYTLLYIEEGEGMVLIDNHKIRIEESKVIIIPPRCINSIEINKSAKGKIICFNENFF